MVKAGRARPFSGRHGGAILAGALGFFPEDGELGSCRTLRASSRALRLASGKPVFYLCCVVKQPWINAEEGLDKVVGRRTKAPNALSLETSGKADAIAWQRALGGVRVPRGVHRFHTHEEADEWLWRMIARPRPS
jgi:hypothetical protein